MIAHATVEPSLSAPPSGAHFQFERVGYFCVDPDSDAHRPVFNRTAPAIKLKRGRSTSDYIELAGLLNSSVSCFWLKQILQDKGNGGIGGGISDERWELRYEHNATQVADLPVPIITSSAGPTTSMMTICRRCYAMNRAMELIWPIRSSARFAAHPT